MLTAPPAEVRRKSTIDQEMEITGPAPRSQRSCIRMTADERRDSEEQLRRAVLTLWRTNLLRRTKLTVLDEVAGEGVVILRLHAAFLRGCRGCMARWKTWSCRPNGQPGRGGDHEAAR